MTGPTIDPHEWIAAQQANAAQLREKAERVRGELAATSATARSADSAVTVTVGAGGVLQAISFGRTASSLGPERLAAITMRAYASAARDAAVAATAVMSQLVGPDSPTMAVLRDAIPPPLPDEKDDIERSRP